MQIDIIFKPIEDYVEMINQKKHFSFSRYWDGEIAAILGRSGTNCDGCRYTAELSDELKKTIGNNHEYYHALNFPSDHTGTVNLRNGFVKYLKDTRSGVKWYDAQVWQRSFERGAFADQVVKPLLTKEIIFIGGEHLESIIDFLPLKKYITISRTDAFSERKDIVKCILSEVEFNKNLIVIFCAGMTSNCVIDEVYPVVGAHVTMLDMGSVWDAYLGLETRQWIRRVPISTRRKSRGQ